MAEAEASTEDMRGERRFRLRRRVLTLVAIVLAILGALLAWLWSTRQDIADNVIGGLLREYEIPGSYEIESIGLRRQVLRNIVLGDPARPDLIIERAEITISPRLGFPRIGEVRLVRPRLYGRFSDGKLSFGSLDPLLFERERTEPPRMPDIELVLEDGRALVRSEYGPLGAKAEGKGNLAGGFQGVIAAIAPRLAVEDCVAERLTVYGRISVKGARPAFDGPLRLGSLGCRQSGLVFGGSAIALQARGDEDLEGFDLRAGLQLAALGYGGNRAARLAGTSRMAWRDNRLTGDYDLRARGLVNGIARVGLVRVEGSIRARDSFERMEWLGDLTGEGIRPGAALDAALVSAGENARETLLGPMLAQLRAALLRETPDSRMAASFALRRAKDATTVVVPNAVLRGGSGTAIASLSRFQFRQGGDGVPRMAGNFATSGQDIPRISARLELDPGANATLRMVMAPYTAGEGSLALPQLVLIQKPKGELGFAGDLVASGPLPGGSARNLAVPLLGNWSSAAGLSLWPRCTELRFDRLQIADLMLDRRGIEVCPARGQPILRGDSRGLRIAAGISGLDLAGKLGQTPIRISGGALGVAVPGTLAARNLAVTLGPADAATSFQLTRLDAVIGREISGRFDDADVRLHAVPLDLLDARGTWRYSGGGLSLGNAEFRLEDRQVPGRFQPLVARGAELTLFDNVIQAAAILREPSTEREAARVGIRHDLASGSGRADLNVPGLLFDNSLQPDTLSRLALGVIANARGTVRGDGIIEWDADGVTSSGSFSTDSLDFAAAFGPVQGASGTVVFTDLVGMTTAPGQRLRVKSINPGIEVNDGEVVFDLERGEIFTLRDARWPFLGGRLSLRPVAMRIGVAEERRYVLDIDGLNAGQFVERMELANLSATGTFDGSLPLVFDENGGRIEQGTLHSRPPGGNVSYVGELTYKDLSAMANFAFDTLRSLDYTRMSITMDGPLTGEIVTRVGIDGVKQGTGAKSNFLTRRIARLPIRFNVNIRAPFYKLVTSIKTMYDPAFIRDPREIGLLDARGRPLDRQLILRAAPRGAVDAFPSKPVQPAESENAP